MCNINKYVNLHLDGKIKCSKYRENPHVLCVRLRVHVSYTFRKCYKFRWAILYSGEVRFYLVLPRLSRCFFRKRSITLGYSICFFKVFLLRYPVIGFVRIGLFSKIHRIYFNFLCSIVLWICLLYCSNVCFSRKGIGCGNTQKYKNQQPQLRMVCTWNALLLKK